MVNDTQKELEQLHTKLYLLIRDLFHIQDMSGVEVFSSLGRILQMVEMLDAHFGKEGQSISVQRFRLMLQLFFSEQMGQSESVTPTELSHFQKVSKNTVSSLLRGLEEQGYIVRELDPKDFRLFRIHLSDSGRQLMLEMTPRRIEYMNHMLCGLTEQEIHQLIELLAKLRRSLEDQFNHSQRI